MMHDLHVGPTAEVLRPGGLELTAKGAKYCSFRTGALVADVGCGAGASIEFLQDAFGISAAGIDQDIMSLKHGILRNPSLPLVHGTAESLPFASASLDGILVECTLSVIADKDRALAEFSRALRQSGRLVVTDVYARDTSAISSLNNLALPFCMSGIMTKESLSNSLVRNSFIIELWEDHSYVLKEFIIQLIMENSSVQAFCGRHDTNTVDPLLNISALKKACIGYFLLVARKET